MSGREWRRIVGWAVLLKAIGLAIIGLAVLLFPPHGSILAHWDSLFYARLARDGLASVVHDPDGRALAFLPFYPLTMTPLVRLGVPVYIAGAIVSNLAAVAALVGLGVLAIGRDGEGDPVPPMVLLAATPAALFLSLGYSEALYLALTVWTFVALQRERPWLAGILCAGATATRPTGAFLAAAFVIAWLRRSGWRPAPRTVLWLVPVLLIPLALVLVGLDYALAGASPWASPLSEHTAWGYQTVSPLTVVLDHARALPVLARRAPPLFVVAVFNLVAAVLAIPLAVLCARVRPPEETVYVLVLLASSLVLESHLALFVGASKTPLYLPLLSTHRFLLVAFPLALAVARIRRRLPYALILVALYIGQFVLAVFFTHDIWVG